MADKSFPQMTWRNMSHSERAVTLSMYHSAIKHQGRRIALIRETENMANVRNINGSEDFGVIRQRMDSRQETGQKYDLSSSVVAYYLRVDKLSGELKERLDNGEIALRAAVTLSYLSGDEQQMVDDILDSSHYKLDMKKAESLRTAAGRKPLDHETVEQILAGTKKPRSAKSPAFKLKPRIISRYFTPEQKADEIETTIIEALEYYQSEQEPEMGGRGIRPRKLRGLYGQLPAECTWQSA